MSGGGELGVVPVIGSISGRWRAGGGDNAKWCIAAAAIDAELGGQCGAAGAYDGESDEGEKGCENDAACVLAQLEASE